MIDPCLPQPIMTLSLIPNSELSTVNPCFRSNLERTVRQTGKQLADADERKEKKYQGSFSATYSLLHLVMSTCGELGFRFVCSHQRASSRAPYQGIPASGSRRQFPLGSQAFSSRHCHNVYLQTRGGIALTNKSQDMAISLDNIKHHGSRWTDQRPPSCCNRLIFSLSNML